MSFIRVVIFSVIYGGIEFRYVNRREAEWTRGTPGFYEKALLGTYSPYHIYFLLPVFIVVGFTQDIPAWAANVFLAALVEDVFYFVWRKKWVAKGEWTTMLFGSFRLGGHEVPIWWVLVGMLVAALYYVPFW